MPLLNSDGSVLPHGKESLILIIQEYIKAGSIIYSDVWKVYKALEDEDLQHLMINHSVNLVYPDNQNVYAQNIKRLWLDIKQFIRRPGVCTQYFMQHLGKYLFLKESEGTELHNFLIQAARLYPYCSNSQPARPRQPALLHQLEENDSEDCKLDYEPEFVDIDRQPDSDSKNCKLHFDKDHKPEFVDVHHLPDFDEEDFKFDIDICPPQ